MPRPKQTAITKPRPFTTPSVASPSILQTHTPSLLQTVKEGVGFGIGSAIGHRIIGGLFGPSSSQSQEPKRRPTEYEQCLAEHRDFGDSAAFCSYLLKAKETPVFQE
jgi:hypothetical protein